MHWPDNKDDDEGEELGRVVKQFFRLDNGGCRRRLEGECQIVKQEKTPEKFSGVFIFPTLKL